MRYRTGPIAGTMILTVLALLGIGGEITSGFRGQSVGSSIFGLVIIVLFAALSYAGLNELRGVRTERQPDGTVVLKLPGLVPTRRRWWRTVPATDVETIYLVLVSSRRSRLYNLAVTLRDGTQLTSGAIAVNRPRRLSLTETRAGRMIELIGHDLGIDAEPGPAASPA